MFLWFVFCVFGKDVSVLKMFVFPVWGALGGHILVSLGLKGLGVLCSLFLFFVCLGLFSFKLFFFRFVGGLCLVLCCLLGFFFHLFFCCLFCFVCGGVFLLLLVFLMLFIFGMFLFCSLCFLEWSKCCYCFVFWFVLFVFVCFICVCLFCVCCFLFLMKIIVFRAFLVFWGMSNMRFGFSFQFLVLVFVSVLFVFCFKMFVCFCFSVCSLVLF